jgi:hypothetical protein
MIIVKGKKAKSSDAADVSIIISYESVRAGDPFDATV